jgi:hypothetical protein
MPETPEEHSEFRMIGEFTPLQDSLPAEDTPPQRSLAEGRKSLRSFGGARLVHRHHRIRRIRRQLKQIPKRLHRRFHAAA